MSLADNYENNDVQVWVYLWIYKDLNIYSPKENKLNNVFIIKKKKEQIKTKWSIKKVIIK